MDREAGKNEMTLGFALSLKPVAIGKFRVNEKSLFSLKE